MIENFEKPITTKEDAKKSLTNTKIADGGGEESELVEGKILGVEDSGDPASEPMKTPYSKHPLEHSWTFWFDNPSAKYKQTAWGSNIRPVHTVSFVEDFWSVYNNVHQPSKLVVGADFHCFKNKIEPKWEDPVCAKGGKWTVCFARGKSDVCWLYTLLAMIGEQFDCGDEICGAVVNVRARQEKIAIWTKNAANEAAQLRIGKQWKEFVEYNDTIGFIFHEDAMKERVAKIVTLCNCIAIRDQEDELGGSHICGRHVEHVLIPVSLVICLFFILFVLFLLL